MNSCQTDFRSLLHDLNPSYTQIAGIKTLQVNLGNQCNLSCRHCHHGASPAGRQVMGRPVMEAIAALVATNCGIALDITGGAPELHPDFSYFVELTAGRAEKRILRSNLAIMTEPGMEWLPDFCRRQNLSITASLPCYLEENVDGQRGAGTYQKSIAALKELNRLGYGRDLELNLVYNPGGRFLPPSQVVLEETYRHELRDRHGITFNRLFTITNAPIGRFRDQLEREGKLASYLELLKGSFNPAAAGSIMCRTMVSIDWQGHLYNCDFHQPTGRHLTGSDGSPLTVFDLQRNDLESEEILFEDYCYGCTAGEGSSCSGALAV